MYVVKYVVLSYFVCNFTYCFPGLRLSHCLPWDFSEDDLGRAALFDRGATFGFRASGFIVSPEESELTQKWSWAPIAAERGRCTMESEPTTMTTSA